MTDTEYKIALLKIIRECTNKELDTVCEVLTAIAELNEQSQPKA